MRSEKGSYQPLEELGFLGKYLLNYDRGTHGIPVQNLTFIYFFSWKQNYSHYEREGIGPKLPEDLNTFYLFSYPNCPLCPRDTFRLRLDSIQNRPLPQAEKYLWGTHRTSGNCRWDLTKWGHWENYHRHLHLLGTYHQRLCRKTPCTGLIDAHRCSERVVRSIASTVETHTRFELQWCILGILCSCVCMWKFRSVQCYQLAFWRWRRQH